MTKKTITLTVSINATLAYAYYAFTNKSGWMEWFAHKAYGYSKKTGMLRVDHEPEGDFAFHFTAEKPEERIIFDFIDLGTMETSEVEVNFEEDNGLVSVSLEHREVDEKSYTRIKSIWEKGLENLVSVLEEGKDLRLWNRPFLGVLVEGWITPETASERGFPVEYGMLLSNTISGGGAEKAGLIKGDIITKTAGHELHSFNEFLDFTATVKAGDEVEIEYFRDGKKEQLDLTMMSYPVADPPANAHELADQIANFQEKAVTKIVHAFEESNDAQADYRPAVGEWSAKETLAHLAAYEIDSQIWITTLIGGCEEYPCQASHPVRIKALVSLYPTVKQLIEEWNRRQQQTVAILQELPAEFVNRKGSYRRMAGGLNLDFTRHYKEHVAQIVNTLEKAENIRAS